MDLLLLLLQQQQQCRLLAAPPPSMFTWQVHPGHGCKGAQQPSSTMLRAALLLLLLLLLLLALAWHSKDLVCVRDGSWHEAGEVHQILVKVAVADDVHAHHVQPAASAGTNTRTRE
jgi:hypothetical protein